MITISLDQRFAIFSSINGGDQNRPYAINSLLHTYAMDLLLGRKPWLDIRMGLACRVSQYLASNTNRSIPPWRTEESYTGVYEHPAMGQVRVEGTTRKGLLFMQYGLLQFILYPLKSTSECDVYDAEAVTRDWMISEFHVEFFRDQDNNIESVLLPFTEGQDDAMFVHVTECEPFCSFSSCRLLAADLLLVSCAVSLKYTLDIINAFLTFIPSYHSHQG